MSTNNHADFTNTTARLAILKAKAAHTCGIHPDVLILSGDRDAENRAYTIAQNTLRFNDKIILLENVTLAVEKELNLAGCGCHQCLQNVSNGET